MSFLIPFLHPLLNIGKQVLGGLVEDIGKHKKFGDVLSGAAKRAFGSGIEEFTGVKAEPLIETVVPLAEQLISGFKNKILDGSSDMDSGRKNYQYGSGGINRAESNLPIYEGRPLELGKINSGSQPAYNEDSPPPALLESGSPEVPMVESPGKLQYGSVEYPESALGGPEPIALENKSNLQYLSNYLKGQQYQYDHRLPLEPGYAVAGPNYAFPPGAQFGDQTQKRALNLASYEVIHGIDNELPSGRVPRKRAPVRRRPVKAPPRRAAAKKKVVRRR